MHNWYSEIEHDLCILTVIIVTKILHKHFLTKIGHFVDSRKFAKL